MRRVAILLTATAATVSLAGCSLFRSAPPAYNVFFTDASARLDDPARNTIVEAARVANARPSDPVILAGFANAKNAGAKDLARARVDAVSAALTNVGVNGTRIQRVPYAEDPQASSGVASRRVEIDIGR